MQTVEVDPQDLHFTQTSVGATFQAFPNARGAGDRIWEAVYRILSNELSPAEFPRLKVVEYDGLLWSLDNRRLFVFRNALVQRIVVTLVPCEERYLRWLRALEPGMYQGMTKPTYFPLVRPLHTGHTNRNMATAAVRPSSWAPRPRQPLCFGIRNDWLDDLEDELFDDWMEDYYNPYDSDFENYLFSDEDSLFGDQDSLFTDSESESGEEVEEESDYDMDDGMDTMEDEDGTVTDAKSSNVTEGQVEQRTGNHNVHIGEDRARDLEPVKEEEPSVTEPRRSGRLLTKPNILDPSIYWSSSDLKKTARKTVGRQSPCKKE